MKAKLLLLLALLGSFVSFAQGDRELYMTSGQKNSLGVIGLSYSFITHSKIKIADNHLLRNYHFHFGFGFDLVHSVRLAAGADYCFFNHKKLTPLISLDGICGFGSTLGDKDENIWTISNNFYLNPSAGLKYFIGKHLVARLQAGYSFLFGKPEITVTTGTMAPDKERAYVNNIDGGFMILVGLGLHFDHRYNKIERDAL